MRTPEAVAGMLCPVCKVGLAMSDRHGIEIDYCPQCRGIWLDRGELDKIIERSGTEQPAPQPQYQPQSDHRPQSSPWSSGHDPRYKHKRRKSFFEELFD